MNDPYGTMPMFEEVPEQPVAKILTDTSGGYGPVRYTKYRPTKPRKCDDCLAALGKDPTSPASRTAAFKRTQEGTEPLLLCYPHKELRREREAQ
jgi:hypothetical protein